MAAPTACDRAFERYHMISRRDLLKYGMTTAALAKMSSQAVTADDDGVGARTPFKTQPFVEPLPIPLVKTPVNASPTADGSCVDQMAGGRSPANLASPGQHQHIERPDFSPRL